MLTYHAERLHSSLLRMLGHLVLNPPHSKTTNYHRLPINLGKVLQVLPDQDLVSRCRIYF